MRSCRAFGASLLAAALLLRSTAWTQQPAPPRLPLPGPSPLPAPPLAVNPSAPVPPWPQSQFAPFWPSPTQIPAFLAAPAAAPMPSLPALPYWSPSGVLVLPHPQDPVNLKVLADIVQRNLLVGSVCGLREMAPGIFVRLDCRLREPVVPTRQVFTPEKMAMLAKGKLHMSRAQAAPAADRIESPVDGVDHRAERLEGPVKDQGSVGNCTAFSLSTVMDNAILRMHKNDVMSPTHIWSHYALPELSRASSGNMNKAIATLGVWPYSPRQACELAKDSDEECGQAYGVATNSSNFDPILQAQLFRAEASGAYRVVGVDQIAARPVNTDAIAAVLETGADVWAGMDIDATAWKVSATNPVIPEYSATEGGHAVALAGYRKTANGRQFLIHNSWGGTWGDHGFAWASENMVRQHMHYAFKVRVADLDGTVPVAQTDDECADAQLVDAGTGKCAAMCPSRARRTNGRC